MNKDVLEYIYQLKNGAETFWFRFEDVAYDPPFCGTVQEISVRCSCYDPRADENKGRPQTPVVMLKFGKDGHAFVGDFMIPPALRGLGVARWVWHEIYHMLRDDIAYKATISGNLSPVDEHTTENRDRRNALWADLIGHGADKDAVFRPSENGGFGYFEGILRSTWNPWRANFSVSEEPGCGAQAHITLG